MKHGSKLFNEKDVTATGAIPTVVHQTTDLNTAVYTTHGITIEVGANTPELLGQLTQRLPNGSQSAADRKTASASFSVRFFEPENDAEHYELYRENEMLSDAYELADICDQFESTVGIYVAENSLDYVFIHAGCVSWNGKAIL